MGVWILVEQGVGLREGGGLWGPPHTPPHGAQLPQPAAATADSGHSQHSCPAQTLAPGGAWLQPDLCMGVKEHSQLSNLYRGGCACSSGTGTGGNPKMELAAVPVPCCSGPWTPLEWREPCSLLPQGVQHLASPGVRAGAAGMPCKASILEAARQAAFLAPSTTPAPQ